ncbi:MAG: rod shape-determining protein MreC [Planctomycetaceae bacterium]|nr:rod shape-determining protein MreC [Planctomycetaceae bacterium]
MARTKFKPSKLTLFIGLFLTGIILLLLPQSITSKVNFTFIDIFDYFLNMGSAAQKQRINAPESYVSKQEYQRLQTAFANLDQQHTELKQQFEKLSKVRLTEPDPSSGLVIAKIVNRKEHQLIINRGSKDGLAAGQYVLGDNAVIGLIEQVADDISSVQLITSASCKMPIKISSPEINSYFNGTMQGDGKAAAKIFNIPQKYKIKTGNTVYAAERPGLLASARIIGKISKCKLGAKSAVVWDIEVEPIYNFENITYVAIVIIKMPEFK